MIKLTSLEDIEHIRGHMYLIDLEANNLPSIREEISSLLLGNDVIIDNKEVTIIGVEYHGKATSHSVIGLLTKQK